MERFLKSLAWFGVAMLVFALILRHLGAPAWFGWTAVIVESVVYAAVTLREMVR